MKCKNNFFEKEDIPMSIYLSIIHRQYRIFLNNALEKEGINAAQVPILNYLLKHECACQDEMANAYRIDKGSIARSVRKLELMDLIYKEIDPNNRRKHNLYLTEAGQELAEKIWRIDKEWEEKFYSKLDMNKKEMEEVIKKMTLTAINISEETEDNNL